jgi:Undecaprenyl-phosphate glucose phosphotransferase
MSACFLQLDDCRIAGSLIFTTTWPRLIASSTVPNDSLETQYKDTRVLNRSAAISWLPAQASGFCCWFMSFVYVLPVAAAGLVAKFLYVDLFLDQDQESLPYLLAIVVLGFSQSIFFNKMGLFKLASMMEPTVGFGKLFGALGLSFLILLGILYLFKAAEFYSRGWLLCWFGLSLVATIIVRWQASRVVRKLSATGQLRQRVALIGSASMIAAVRDQAARDFNQYEFSGIYVIDGSLGRSAAAGVAEAIKAVRAGLSNDSYERVIVALPLDDLPLIQTIVRGVSSFSVEVLLCTDTAPFPLAISGSAAVGGLRMHVVSAIPAWEQDRLLKYMLDYSVAVVGLLLLAPLLALIALAIKLESPGPVFFRQRRYGYNNRVFHIFKFRTMSVREDGSSVTQAVRNDARVTRVGRLLRSSSLDELPQLINVLLGQMSIVGPRPHALAHDDSFERDLDLFSRRRRVRPGITGWAQVNGYRGETRTLEDVKRRMEFDLHYIDNWSIWLDVEIMARTVLTVSRGAY